MLNSEKSFDSDLYIFNSKDLIILNLAPAL